MFVWNNYLSAIILVVAIGLLIVPLPTNNLWWHEATNTGHTIVFAIISVIVYYQIYTNTRFSNKLLLYFFVLVICMSLGVLIEVLQDLVHRESSLNDVYRNFYGIMMALCLIAVINAKEIQYQKSIIVLIVLASLSFFLLGLTPLIKLSWSYIERDKAFPVILDFNANWSSSFIRFNNAEIKKNSKLQKNNDGRYQIWFNQGKYPGLSVIEPEPDWSAYRILKVTVFSIYKNNINLVLRVHDKKHNYNHSDRFNKSLLVQPGLNIFEIELSDIEKGPVNRKLDLTKVAGLIIFSSGLKESRQLELSNIALE